MAILSNLKRLLIPRKGSNQVDDLDINWRTIERWANALSASGFVPYASLTGAGETVTPGELDQAGDFSITGDFNQSGTSASLSESGTLSITSAFNATFFVTNSTSTLTISCGSGGTISTAVIGNGEFHVSSPDMFFNADGQVFRIDGGSGESFRVEGSGTPTDVIVAGSADALNFFHAGGAVRQTVSGSRAGNVALANLLTALADYGLIVNSTTP